MGFPRFVEFENFRAEVVFNLDRGTFLEHLIKLTLQGYLVHTAQECANPQNALNNSKPYEIKKSHKPVKEKEEYHHNHCDHPQFF